MHLPLLPIFLPLLPLLLLLHSPHPTNAWLPTSPPPGITLSGFAATSKIRGVNLGSQFVVEPWMAGDEWAAMGCGTTKAEFQCVKQAYGGDVARASAAWKKHWAGWVTNADLDEMVGVGLNTVRIPVGWWMKEDLVASGEYFPKGGFAYLQSLCQHAAENGMYVIIEMHGAPGTQNANQPFTGNYSDKAYFYQSDYQSGRAYKFLSWLTTAIQSQPAYFRTVGAIGLLNEPKFNSPNDPDIRWTTEHYYGSAISAVRAAEANLGIAPTSRSALSITIMDDLWHDLSGATDPAAHLTAAQKTGLLFDDHNYETVPVRGMTPAQVVAYACGDDRRTGLQGGEKKVVGEWAMSLAQTGAGFTPEVANRDFWSSYFSAQQWQYERTRGWIYWSWKVQKGGGAGEALQWSYKELETDGRQSFFHVAGVLYNTTLNEYLEDQLNGWRIIAWALDYWTSWYDDESRTGSSDHLGEMQTDLNSYAKQAFPCNESSPTYGSDFMSTVNSTLGLNETSEAPQDPPKATSELRRLLAEKLQGAKDRAAVLRNLVAASYMGVGFGGAKACRAAVNEYLENASEWDKAGASAAGTLLTLLPSLLTLGNLYVPKFSEAAAAGVFVSGASAVSTLGLPVKSISVVGWRQRFETKSFTGYGRKGLAQLGRRVNALSNQARYRVRMEALQAWYAEPSLSWSEDPLDGYMEPVRSPDCTPEGEACENMFWKIKSRVVNDWPNREPFAPLMDSSTILVSYFVTFFGTMLFSTAGIPMQLGSCNSRNYSIWLICGTAISSIAKLYSFSKSGHQILKFYPLSPLAQSTLTANLSLPHDDDSSNTTTTTTPTTTETSLPPLSRPTPLTHLLLPLTTLHRLFLAAAARINPRRRRRSSPSPSPSPRSTPTSFYSTLPLLFRTRHQTPRIPRLRPLTVLLRATNNNNNSTNSNPAHHTLPGLLTGLVFIALTFLFGAQWGGNLVVVFYTVVAFLVVVAAARGLCVWLVWRLGRKAGLHVVECAAGDGGDGDDEVAGVARVLASMTGVLVVSGDGGSCFYGGALVSGRGWWEGWRREYVAGRFDGDGDGGEGEGSGGGGDVERGGRSQWPSWWGERGNKASAKVASETELMGMTELPRRLQ
ncbi:glucan endo-beta-glucosidase b [Diplodia corticola]|uniref:glucan 1,3-beta-glucosidase n=1 Tax=Diplodia corticola TaxID=236234 RepID=A0A1J9QYH4_9PEZI|nr:glucan endo-beta-glucosidase b [Diplodia corticola]OJD33058.1 glucan endo-beta-glucosidase b [Diplodia corticola]